jgi:hypothetical protein
MLSLAILLLVHDRFHSFAVAGIAVGGFTFGVAAAAPTLGRAVDRLGPRVVLPPVAVAHALASAALAGSVVYGAPLLPVVVLAVIAGSAVPPISASVRTVWMLVIPEDEVRNQVFTLDAMATQAVFAGGPLLTSLIVVLSAPGVAILASALIALGGTLIYVRSPLLRRTEGNRTALKGRRGARRQAFRVLTSTGVGSVLGCVLLAGAGAGTMEVSLPALAVHLGSRATSGVMLGLWAAAGIAGGWMYTALRWTAPIRARYRAAALASAALTLPLIGASSVAVAIGLSVVAGLPSAVLYACQYGLVGELAPRDSITESFTWMVAAIVAGAGAGSVAGGATITAAGVPACLLLGAALLIAIAFVPIPTTTR